VTSAAAVAGWLTALGCAMWVVALQRALGRRAELVTRACHEIRGPLTAARLGMHFLGSHSRVQAVDAELRRVARALDDLDAARAGRRARDDDEPGELARLLADAALAWEPVARAHGGQVHLGGADGLVVRGDRIRLAQACGNLLANAVEHGGGAIELRARAVGRRVRIEVTDHGPGLPAPVARLASGARNGRGRRGRGLAIASEIAARHGGRLAAAPSSVGARLMIELPAARRPPGAKRAAAAAPGLGIGIGLGLGGVPTAPALGVRRAAAPAPLGERPLAP
jgi:signal transduction histidine kinase